jgi:hypothetical protein
MAPNINAILKVVNAANEHWSIHRSLFICKDELELQVVFWGLFDKGYPVTKEFIQPEKYRILVNTWDTFDLYKNMFNFSEFTVIYTTDYKRLRHIRDITDEYKIKCLAIV